MSAYGKNAGVNHANYQNYKQMVDAKKLSRNYLASLADLDMRISLSSVYLAQRLNRRDLNSKSVNTQITRKHESLSNHGRVYFE